MSIEKIKIDSLIFDLDGTLWDSTNQIADAWNLLLEQKSYKKREKITAKELHQNMGLPMYEIAKNLFPFEKESFRNNLMDEMGVFENEYLIKKPGILYDGIKEVIENLKKKIPLFIVSNCQSGYIEAFLKAYDFEKYFKDIECWGNTKLSKGENILKLLKRNNLKSPIYIGDTNGDFKATIFANVPFIYASYGFGDVCEKTNKINHIAEIFDFISF